MRLEEDMTSLAPGQTKDARELLGWSQEVLAACLGVSSAAVVLFETSGRLGKNLHREDIREILGNRRGRIPWSGGRYACEGAGRA